MVLQSTLDSKITLSKQFGWIFESKCTFFSPQRSLIDYEFLWNNLLTVEKRRNIDKKAAQNKLDLIALEPIL